MSTTTSQRAVLVLSERTGPPADAVRALLAELNVAVDQEQWFVPRDADDLARQISTQHDALVICSDAGVYMHAVWEQRIDALAWQHTGVDVRFAEVPQDAGLAIRELAAHLGNWQQQRRRGRTLAGLMLSVLAIALAFVLLLLAR